MTAAVASRLPDLLGTSPADLLPEGDRHDSTPAEARERADRLRAGIVRYAEMRQDIADAFACRDWFALGYQHWAAYVEGEFGEQLAQLGRGDRRQAVADLRGQGMSTRQIAGATGMAQTQVIRDLKSQVNTNGSPEKVTGSDGKQHPASRPTPKPAETPGPVDAPSAAQPVGPGSTSPEPGRHLHSVPPPSSLAVTPEQRQQIVEDAERTQTINNARKKADRLVREVSGLITEIVSGVRYGEPGLITAEMVAGLRAEADRLESYMEAQA